MSPDYPVLQPFYVSPEVVEKHCICKGSDVYGFGVLMWCGGGAGVEEEVGQGGQAIASNRHTRRQSPTKNHPCLKP